MQCKKCKTTKREFQMHNSDLCNDCFMISMAEEDKEFEIYYRQNCKCALCEITLKRWQIKEGEAVCSPRCIIKI